MKWAGELMGLRKALRGMEKEIAQCAAAGEFGQRFTELARAAYQSQARHGALLREVKEQPGYDLG